MSREHRYLSTSCWHDEHEDCQTNAVRYDGTSKVAGTCKWCHAPCVCPCHCPADQDSLDP